MDDMFVIVQALDSVDAKILNKAPVHIQMAHAMRSAGVSITVTSLTDILAFAVGTSTVHMPHIYSLILTHLYTDQAQKL